MKNKLLCLIFGKEYAKRKRIERLIRKFERGEIGCADYVKEIDSVVSL